MATLKDIALLVGVSTCTVSRYINGKITVRKDTAEKIDRAIKDLGYTKNFAAVSLKTQSSRSVAVVFPSLKNIFFAEIAEHINRVLETRGYTMITLTTDNLDSKEREAARKILELRAAGAIFMTLPYDHQDSSHILQLEGQGIPCVMINRYFEAGKFTAVSTDFLGGAREGTNLLLAGGARKIGLIVGAPVQPQSRVYIQGYRESLEAAGLEADEDLIRYCYYDEGKVARATRDFLRMGTDAIFAISDYTALAVLDEVKRQQWRIPEDVSVLGSGNSRFAQLTGLTSLDSRPVELGTRGAEILLQRIHRENDSQFVLIEPEFSVRESVRTIQ